MSHDFGQGARELGDARSGVLGRDPLELRAVPNQCKKPRFVLSADACPVANPCVPFAQDHRVITLRVLPKLLDAFGRETAEIVGPICELQSRPMRRERSEKQLALRDDRLVCLAQQLGALGFTLRRAWRVARLRVVPFR